MALMFERSLKFQLLRLGAISKYPQCFRICCSANWMCPIHGASPQDLLCVHLYSRLVHLELQAAERERMKDAGFHAKGDSTFEFWDSTQWTSSLANLGCQTRQTLIRPREA